MPLADTKKAQTIRNLWHTKVAKKVLEADAAVALIRAAIEDNSLAGQFTAPEIAAMLATESDLGVTAGGVGVTAAESKYRPHHSTEQATVGLEV
jgi:hypothetical protein